MEPEKQLEALYRVGPALGHEDHQDVLGWAETTKMGPAHGAPERQADRAAGHAFSQTL